MKGLARKRFAVRIVDAKNLAWWFFALAVVVGVFVLVTSFAPGVATFPTAFVCALVLSVPFVLAWWLLLRIPQLWARISRSGAIAAILWGGIVAPALFALPANGALLTAIAQHLSISVAHDWGPALVAPVTEETGKAFAVVIVMLLSRQSLRTPMDSALLAAFSAVGFSMTEDVIYAINIASLNLGENEVVSTLVIYLARAVIFGLATHVVFSGLVGAGIGWIATVRSRSRIPVGLALIAAGPAAHWLWNSPLLGSWWYRLAYLVLIPFAMWLLLHRIRRHEHREFLSVLGVPGVLDGIDPAYLATVKATWWQRRAYRSSVVRAYGPGALAAQRWLEAALSDMADAVAAGDHQTAAHIKDAIVAGLARQPAVG